mmetsp:Transcript_42103/g.48840  ORF Transcript_42103/g.48840 Transcript_42103/m.48840 type:complete len:212 (-) Transcript_42103:4104-4739(-)
MNDKLSAYKDCKNINVRRRTKEERENELPRYLAASNLQIVKQVIEKGLKSKSHALRCESLQFFEYIPPNSDRRNKMIMCKKLAKRAEVENWLEFIYCQDLQSQSLYYGLKIMKSILIPIENKMTKEEEDEFKSSKVAFYKRFVEVGGFGLLCSTLESLNPKTILKDVVWLSIFQTILNILHFMLEDNSFRTILSPEKHEQIKKSTVKLVAL